MKTENRVRWIRQIVAQELFGHYNYDLGLAASETSHNRIMILYGDNGSGKTTLLKIAFHLLAPEGRNNHKSNVSAIPFKSFSIVLNDGTSLTAKRESKNIVGSFSLTLKFPRRKPIIADFISDDDFTVPASEDDSSEVNILLAELKSLNLELYMLTDDRKIHLAGGVRNLPGNQHMTDYETEVALRNRMRRSNMDRNAIDPEEISFFLLQQSMNRAEGWIRSKAMLGSSVGESDVNTLYNEILPRLLSVQNNQTSESYPSLDDIVKRIRLLETRSESYAKYGLIPLFKGTSILRGIKAAKNADIVIVNHVLNPYLESLERKLAALSIIHKKIDSFISIINSFLTNKYLSYGLHSGFDILTRSGTRLRPKHLSSGERHLLLLFCNSIVASDHPSIMIIDEPEISLNIKWQRKLVSALLECLGESNVQYIFATHSIELLAKHKDMVQKLEHRP